MHGIVSFRNNKCYCRVRHILHKVTIITTTLMAVCVLAQEQYLRPIGDNVNIVTMFNAVHNLYLYNIYIYIYIYIYYTLFFAFL